MEKQISNLQKQFQAAGYINDFILYDRMWYCLDLPYWCCDLCCSYVQVFSDPDTNKTLWVVEAYEGMKGIWIPEDDDVIE